MAETEPQSADSEPAHEVLAAEAFALPASDPELRHRPVVLPEDPTGIPEPHDVLAAEEFPMPSARPGSGSGQDRPGQARRGAMAVAAGLLAWLLLKRRRS